MDTLCNDTFYMCYPDYPDEDPFPDEYDIFEEDLPVTGAQMGTPLLGHVFNICILCLASVSFLLNGIIITIYCVMKKSCRKIPNFMLFNQAVVDTMISIYAILSTLPSYIKELFGDMMYANVTMILGYYTVFLSLGVLLLTSGERFMALRKPFFHRRFLSKTKIRLGIGVVYLTAFLPCVVYICYLNESGVIDKPNFYVVYGGIRVALVFAGTLVVLSLLFLSYRAVKTAIQSRCKTLLPTSDRVENPERNRRIMLSERKKQKKMISIFITMATVFTISYLPMAVFNTIRGYFITTIGDFEMFVIEIVGFLLYIASAFVNPLLTLCLKDDYKRYLLCWTKKKGEPEGETKTELVVASSGV